MSFLKHRHKLWQEKHQRWEFTWKSYTGEYAVNKRADLFKNKKRDAIKIEDQFLHRKVQAETLEAYSERLYTSDPILLFPFTVDSTIGMLSSASKEEPVRDFGDLGEVDDKKSDAGRLWRNADGKNTNWIPVMNQIAVRLTALHRVWILFDGFETDENGDLTGSPKIRIINPNSVVNWFEDKQGLESVLVQEEADARSSIKDNPKNEEQYVLYTRDGWERYREKEGNPDLIDSGEYEYWESGEKRFKTLPIFPVEIPLPRDVGHLLAVKQNHYYNQKSIRDFAVRNISFATLVLTATGNQYKQFIDDIKQGFRVIRKDPEASGSHEYISPPSQWLTTANGILKDDKEEFLMSAFREFGDSAKQSTATEIRQESRSGIESYLSLLAETMDEAENHIMLLAEQTYFGQDSSKWERAFVKRSKEFSPEDVNEAMKARTEVATKGMQSGAMSLKTAVETQHPDWTPDEVQEEIDMILRERGGIPEEMLNG